MDASADKNFLLKCSKLAADERKSVYSQVHSRLLGLITLITDRDSALAATVNICGKKSYIFIGELE